MNKDEIEKRIRQLIDGTTNDSECITLAIMYLAKTLEDKK